jgi:hypothetical protein
MKTGFIFTLYIQPIIVCSLLDGLPSSKERSDWVVENNVLEFL